MSSRERAATKPSERASSAGEGEQPLCQAAEYRRLYPGAELGVRRTMHCADGLCILLRHTMPTEAGPGFQSLTGALIRRGEAVAEIAATDVRPKFGRNAKSIRMAYIKITKGKAIVRAVRKLAILNRGGTVMSIVYRMANNTDA